MVKSIIKLITVGGRRLSELTQLQHTINALNPIKTQIINILTGEKH